MRWVFVAPLEIVTGTSNFFAISTSFRRLERRRILWKLFNEMRGAMSISRDESALEASSASAWSKNRLRGFVEGKERRSTRRSLAACLATAFDVQITDMTSNFRLNRLRLWSSSRGVFGERSTLVTRSILILLHMFCSCLTMACLTFGGRVMPIMW